MGRPEQILVFAMLGTMIGYFAWSFFEFLYDEKPFWEFLGIYTVLWAWTRTLKPETDEEVPELPVPPDDETAEELEPEVPLEAQPQPEPS